MRHRRRSLRGIRTAALACLLVAASPAADQVLGDDIDDVRSLGQGHLGLVELTRRRRGEHPVDRDLRDAVGVLGADLDEHALLGRLEPTRR